MDKSDKRYRNGRLMTALGAALILTNAIGYVMKSGLNNPVASGVGVILILAGMRVTKTSKK